MLYKLCKECCESTTAPKWVHVALLHATYYPKNDSWLPKIDNSFISEKMWVGSSSSGVSQENDSYSNICRGKNGRT